MAVLALAISVIAFALFCPKKKRPPPKLTIHKGGKPDTSIKF